MTDISAHGDEAETAEAAFAAEYRAVTDPDDGQKWPKGLTEEDGKLYRNGKLLVPESRVLELCEAWHHHMLHPGVKKQALDMQPRSSRPGGKIPGRGACWTQLPQGRVL